MQLGQHLGIFINNFIELHSFYAFLLCKTENRGRVRYGTALRNMDKTDLVRRWSRHPLTEAARGREDEILGIMTKEGGGNKGKTAEKI